MSLFGNLKTEGLEEAEDRVGGNFGAVDTDVYLTTIAAFYHGKSPKGAQFIQIIGKLPNGKELRNTVYITNQKGENFFMAKDKDKKETGKRAPLPGFTLIDDICMITTGKPLSEQDTEEKTVKVYDADAKKELPKSVPMLTDVVGKEVKLAVQKVLENKSDKVGDEYVPNAETRELNEIVKAIHPELNMTIVEAKNGADAPAYHDAWLESNKGKIRDKRSIKDGVAGVAGAPPKAATKPGQAPAAASAEPRKSLFGAKKAAVAA